MSQVVAAKEPHTFHRASGPEDFRKHYRDRVGAPLEDLVARFAPLERVEALLLGGALPLGFGTGVSDLDVQVFLDGPDAWRKPEPEQLPGPLIYAGRTAPEAAQLKLAEAVVLVAGLEVDLVFLVSGEVDALARRLAAAQVDVPEGGDDLVQLSRVKTGWLLAGSEAFEERCGWIRDDDSLEVRQAVRQLVTAHQVLEDARVALDDHLPLACSLGRHAVEWGLQAYLSSEGFPALSAKWLRLLSHHAQALEDDEVTALVEEALELLFPIAGDRPWAAAYLERVEGHLERLRRLMERRVTYRAAFALCPQL